ncbi:MULTISPECIES: twin-arginine translocase subunit TatC [Alishewanella]|jgi:sec-independent protein translocase protein TatC|uniref:Sec-independent protein translocase protein TatC n=2 Tax=Alishewanella TaxID=111142 RepID=H3ZF02_9ALTE|nr:MULTISPECIES: twin-arginine translocase subunit TatC [Alishewanella]EHR40820.1 Sec-independent protein translocase protein TatC [Alishewanella jeotgali KCTC 22429]EJI84459.1 Sec-independent protein translocase protein TatC [Alishewanella aestuarii B11]MCT8125235.1 twin-arginine translocase subunit TatC [Alishewanella sp. BS5-314]OCW98063.1 twin arginine-targeting protein translocase TatC [Alishewanella sp. HH-ZS]
MKTKPDPDSLLGHLVELRNRLLRCVIAVLIVFAALAYFARDIYALLAEPLLAVLPEGTSMIATDVAAPFFAPFKLTFIVAICLAIPYILWQVWQFIAPALYSREKKLMAPLVFSSTLLFYAGIAFAYFVVFPLIFAFFTSVAPAGVTIATDISSYLDFVLKLFFAFGLSFEIPIAILLLIWSGSVTRQALAEKRPYIIVGAFVLGMLLTPPDVLSQTLLAIPMWLLFEAGLWLSRFYQPKTDEPSQEQEP